MSNLPHHKWGILEDTVRGSAEMHPNPLNGVRKVCAMRTAFMTTVTLDETRVYEVLKRRTDGKVCLKKAIAAVVTNNSGLDLHYSTIMSSGKVEADSAVIKASFAAVVQPDGELNVQIDPKGRATHTKLYDMDNPLTPDKAHELAVMRGLTIPTVQQVMAALKLIDEDVDPRQLPWTYAESKGKVMPFRCALRFELPKAQWQSVQVAEVDASIVVNLITNEAYYIGRDELVKNWVLEADQGLNATKFWDSLPIIGNDDFDAMMS